MFNQDQTERRLALSFRCLSPVLRVWVCFSVQVIHEEHIAELFYVPTETGVEPRTRVVAADAHAATHISSRSLQKRLKLFQV